MGRRLTPVRSRDGRAFVLPPFEKRSLSLVSNLRQQVRDVDGNYSRRPCPATVLINHGRRRACSMRLVAAACAAASPACSPAQITPAMASTCSSQANSAHAADKEPIRSPAFCLHIPPTLRRLFEGRNEGKQLLRFAK